MLIENVKPNPIVASAYTSFFNNAELGTLFAKAHAADELAAHELENIILQCPEVRILHDFEDLIAKLRFPEALKHESRYYLLPREHLSKTRLGENIRGCYPKVKLSPLLFVIQGDLSKEPKLSCCTLYENTQLEYDELYGHRWMCMGMHAIFAVSNFDKSIKCKITSQICCFEKSVEAEIEAYRQDLARRQKAAEEEDDTEDKDNECVENSCSKAADEDADTEVQNAGKADKHWLDEINFTLITGRELCWGLKLDYNAIMERRERERQANTEYFIHQICTMPSLRPKLEELLKKQPSAAV